jgi:hypothetical protein
MGCRENIRSYIGSGWLPYIYPRPLRRVPPLKGWPLDLELLPYALDIRLHHDRRRDCCGHIREDVASKAKRLCDVVDIRRDCH